MPARTPVYFISHGGPNVMEETSHPAYAQLQEIGREITQKVKPKAIIVISAHWQAPSPPKTASRPLHPPNNISSPTTRTIQISLPTTVLPPPLIYDFTGFPPHYYRKTFPYRTSPALAERILQAFVSAGGFKAEGIPDRGLDHGVWAPFSCMFDPHTNPLSEEVPVVQVSLLGSEEDGEGHLRVGEVLRKFRDRVDEGEGCVVVGSGMAVHNLRDLWGAMARSRQMGEVVARPLGYTDAFDEALREAVEGSEGEERRKGMLGLLERRDLRQAHPSLEHLLPIFVAAGAAGEEEVGKRLWTLGEGSMSWAQFRFGEVD
ncbi:aromatic ring-opening dioxygenase LigB subunit [Hortaea werneckii]|uniref:Extradiol ring-cleavage dioxygenase class III enzyme subunit B domain-containing protein n=1 Tax=Hortaea werneckii TaxID=91943 RepID=A0A3M7I4K4_HORWE|nr:aromatic ring-opening dioxygenase LigB subunit [Hortaea werneckii]KAI6790669.1 aromatic ring-opening dioxygenase LigB subunit [Hortaea werneckii]KAI6896821.1 aromatic ring-opening dioxygenase LigB subunit [Hortaea werneckii]KAI6918247.1 aromatic ring-opening dioxygenase LigB subunit [Hortaea werneckii]KAI6951751.1 aromatic ring-opening dioxygenase LigB subunit [Hortaea werneckii]